MQTPSIGRIVITNVHATGNNGATIAPAIITRVYESATGWLVNLRVFLDGEQIFWKTSVKLGDAPVPSDLYACWYPPRV